MVVTREAMSSSAVSTELRILISATNFLSSVRTTARFNDVSTEPGIAALMPMTPVGRARRSERMQL